MAKHLLQLCGLILLVIVVAAIIQGFLDASGVRGVSALGGGIGFGMCQSYLLGRRHEREDAA